MWKIVLHFGPDGISEGLRECRKTENHKGPNRNRKNPYGILKELTQDGKIRRGNFPKQSDGTEKTHSAKKTA